MSFATSTKILISFSPICPLYIFFPFMNWFTLACKSTGSDCVIFSTVSTPSSYSILAKVVPTHLILDKSVNFVNSIAIASSIPASCSSFFLASGSITLSYNLSVFFVGNSNSDNSTNCGNGHQHVFSASQSVCFVGRFRK